MNKQLALRILKKELPFTKVHCNSNQLIVAQGSEIEFIYYLEQGWTRHGVISNKGRESIFRICAPGEFIGVTTLFKTGVFPINATAITPCELRAYNKYSLESFLLKHPHIMSIFVAELGERILKIQELKMSSNQQDAFKQVRDLLVHLANAFGTNVPSGRLIPFNLTQQVIADFLGLSRPRVSFCLKRLLEMGHIHRQERNYVVPYPDQETASNAKEIFDDTAENES